MQAQAGRWKDCETSLQRLRGNNANITEEAAEIRVMLKNLLTLISWTS